MASVIFKPLNLRSPYGNGIKISLYYRVLSSNQCSLYLFFCVSQLLQGRIVQVYIVYVHKQHGTVQPENLFLCKQRLSSHVNISIKHYSLVLLNILFLDMSLQIIYNFIIYSTGAQRNLNFTDIQNIPPDATRNLRMYGGF